MFTRLTSLLFLSLTCATAQRLVITDGAVDDQVFQRDETGVASINLNGTAVNLNTKPVEVRVTGKLGPLQGLDWTAAGKVMMNKWSARVDIPTGGPYQIEVRSG